MIGIDIAPELMHAVRRQALDELAQRPEPARVPIPNVLGAVIVALAAPSLPARADEVDKNSRTVAPRSSVFGGCQVLRRAIARRACDARLERDQPKNK
jgi:hypothetical protein